MEKQPSFKYSLPKIPKYNPLIRENNGEKRKKKKKKAITEHIDFFPGPLL